MNLLLIGATGFVGSALLTEALQRGHRVTVLARDPAKLPAREGLTVLAGDATDAATVARAAEGQHALLSAYNPGWNAPDLYDSFLRGSRAIAAAARQAGVRLLVVGGAGSLYVAPGLQLVDTDGFAQQVPPNVVPGAKAARDLLTELQADRSTLDWTLLSPPPLLVPGERTGRYQRGGDPVPMVNGQPAGISVADLAVALLDEAERPQARRARFTVWS